MRKSFSGATLLALTAVAPVFAADLAVKAPPNIPPPLFSWTGCFVGAHLGGVVSEDKETGILGNARTLSSAGFVGGGQVGCDYQFAGGVVLGAEGRAAWTSLQDTHANIVRNLVTGIVVPSQLTVKNDFLASATARLGYSFAGQWLVFVRGGAAWTNEKLDDAFTRFDGLAVDPTASSTRTGWTVGTGAEWAFAPHWSATLEYNYYDFGNNSPVLTDNVGTRVTIFSLKDNIHAVTTGVNYHF
jgi:outer membrane immunogenic protein